MELFLKGVELNAVSVNSQRQEAREVLGPFHCSRAPLQGAGMGECPGDPQGFLSSRGSGQVLFGFTPSSGQDASSSGPHFPIIRLSAFPGAPTFAFSEMETLEEVCAGGGPRRGEGAFPERGRAALSPRASAHSPGLRSVSFPSVFLAPRLLRRQVLQDCLGVRF